MVQNVDFRTRWRGQLDTTPRRIGRWLALSVALHAPLTPVMGLLGLLQFLDRGEDIPTLPPVTEIPLDLIEDDGAFDKAPATAPENPPVDVAPDAVPAIPKPKPDPLANKPPELPDAGAPNAKEETDAGPRDAGAPELDAGKASDAGSGDAGPRLGPGEGIGSPVAGIGNKKVVDPNANVQVKVFNDRVRVHPLGARVGPLLRNVYQWRDFFGPTSIDPIRDIDRMLIIGPQLRDSSQVTAILQFNIAPEKVRAAVDALVARDPEGGWLDAGVPVAKAHADRAERAFVFPAPGILVVATPEIQKSAERLPKSFRIPGPKADEIAIVQLATPWRAFLGAPVVIPKSISSALIRVSPMPDGGVVVDLVAQDATDPLAAQDAEALTRAVKAATELDLGLFGAVLFNSSKKKFVEKVSFEAVGSEIRGEIVLTRAQLETVLDLAAGMLGGGAPRRKAPAPSVPTASPAPGAPTPAAAPTPPPVPTP